MTQTDEFAYCPFIYGYSNYARPDYARRILEFGGVISVASDKAPSTMLGGTGLAISAKCKSLKAAADYVSFVVASETQPGLYFTSGGQPAHRTAWVDQNVNSASSNFFLNTLPALDAAFVRPSYPGYLAFQDRAAALIHRFLREQGDASKVLESLNEVHRQSSVIL